VDGFKEDFVGRMRMVAEKEEGLEPWPERGRMYGVWDGVIGGWVGGMKEVDEAERAGAGLVEVGRWEGVDEGEEDSAGGGGSTEM
jgi:hypothetical protein